MKVLKFGGTSVKDAAAIRQVAKIIEQEAVNDPIIVVVSAFSGVTNTLASIIETARTDFHAATEQIQALQQRHLATYQELLKTSDEPEYLDMVFTNIKDVCHGISLIKEVTKKSEDFILTRGELLSSFIITSFLSTIFDATLFKSQDYLITNKNNSLTKVDLAASKKQIDSIKQFSQVNVFPGFIAAKPGGITTTLGRGGSDYTAALLAHMVKADELQIWTDVDGIMSADPKLVKQARPLEHLSYEEALELSHFGAKVIYPPSIQPAFSLGIPIRIKNTFLPEQPGTLITREWDEDKHIIRGISSIKHAVLINMTGTGMMGFPSFAHRFFKVFAEEKINIIMITQASSEYSMCVAISENDREAAQDGLQTEFERELESGLINGITVDRALAIISLVGSNMRNQVGVSGKMFHTLGKNGISIKAIAQGSSERNISAIIPQTDLRKALNILHESFFLSERKRINLFIIGVGNVGQSFLQQLSDQLEPLLLEHNTKISICGIANSKRMYFTEEGIAIQQWKQLLDKGKPFDPNQFIESIIAMNLRSSIFVDITASDTIAALYEKALEANISVVTPNKIGASGDYANYKKLLDICLRKGVNYLFETNVAAGLPVISTLKDLIKSGDKILKIEAVLSGTLNYLYNTYDGSRPFVEIIKEAKEKGLTEPDPRLDLFGEDVKRKILILARESGQALEMVDVKFKPFVPQACMEAKDLDTFYDLAAKNEAFFQKQLEEATSQGARLRVVASFENGQADVALQPVSLEHPFYHLEGKDNIVLFYTNRYSEQPLVVKGAGAGAEVTASGIFADILKVSMD